MTADAFAADRRSAGRPAWPSGTRTASASRGCARRPTYASTRRAAARPSRSQFLGRPDSRATKPRKMRKAGIATTAASLLGLVGIDRCQPHSREQALIIHDPADPCSGDGDSRSRVARRSRFRRRRSSASACSTSKRSSRRRIARSWRCASTACSPRPASTLWLDGEPLDAGSLLYTPDGQAPRRDLLDRAPRRRRADVLRVAAAQRGARVDATAVAAPSSCARSSTWTKSFGYLPPVANPPSKPPLLTLLKQARAFGVGIVLATQNPVDLDYKALSNTGTWFLGRLQTERDKARVLDGLEGLAGGLDRQTMRHDAVGARQPRVPDAQRARTRAGCVRDALDAVVSAWPDGTRGTAAVRIATSCNGPTTPGGDSGDNAIGQADRTRRCQGVLPEGRWH